MSLYLAQYDVMNEVHSTSSALAPRAQRIKLRRTEWRNRTTVALSLCRFRIGHTSTVVACRLRLKQRRMDLSSCQNCASKTDCNARNPITLLSHEYSHNEKGSSWCRSHFSWRAAGTSHNVVIDAFACTFGFKHPSFQIL